MDRPFPQFPPRDSESFLLFNRDIMTGVKAFKHVFMSPSSVDQEPKATRSGNTCIHGMTQVTPASIAYIATQVSFRSNFARCSDMSRFGLRYVRRLSFLEPILPRIRRRFIRQYSIYLMMSMSKMRFAIY